MSTFATIMTGFRALAIQLTGLQVEQYNSPPKTIDPKKKGRLEFRILACRPISAVTDEIRYTFDAGTNTLIMTSEGMRTITMQVKFEGYDHGPGQDACYYLERLGNRIVWPSSLEALAALDLGLVNRGTFQNFSKVLSAEDREWSIGIKEFIFQAVVNETPDNPADNPSTWIETVIFLSDTLDNVDGNPLVPQISRTVTRP